MDAITLSGNEFKALSSDTRTGIIKMLQDRNYTLSEMSKKMNLAAPTIKQHLSVLENAELIEQVDEGRKWKYYCLTRKGKKMFSDEQPHNILIVLGASFIALAAVLYSFLGKFFGQAQQFAGYPAKDVGDAVTGSAGSIAGETTAPVIRENIIATQPIPIPFETILIWVAGIVILSIVLGFLIASTRNR